MDNFTKKHFDLLVIGGGITGAGIALDAASRGISVALIEMQDFANEMRQMLFNEKNLKKFPVSPVKGKLDLDLVRKSIFFCI